MNTRDHMLGAIAPVAGSDTGRRGNGAADPAYPGLAQCRRRAGIDMPARFHFGKSSDLQSPEDLFSPAGKQFEPDPRGLIFSECWIQTKKLECQPVRLSPNCFDLPVRYWWTLQHTSS